jgi:iron complex transport system substrate-binding protein
LVLLGLVAAATASAQAERSITDAAGRVVRLPEHVEHVWPAGQPASVMLYTLAPATMLGWAHTPSDAAKAFLAASSTALPSLDPLPLGEDADATVLTQAKPDLILDIGTVSPRYVKRAEALQAKLGIPVVLLDGSLEGLAGIYRQLGYILGDASRAEALARETEHLLASARQRFGSVTPEQRLRTYYGRGADGLTTAAKGSLTAEFMEWAGLDNVVTAANDPSGGLVTVTREQVLGWEPDIVLTLDADFAKALTTDSGWSSLRAVRDHRVYLAPRLPFGWLDEPPSVNRLLGLQWLGHTLYPARFAINLRQATRDFYSHFYEVELTPAQLDELLAPERTGSVP